MSITATYSPDDNKLRLYTMGRLDEETYKRVHDAGFRWAPKQELFVCPAWSPTAEDVCLSLAEEITDEDTSLTERAEVRAERFETYAENRASDGETARRSVELLTGGAVGGDAPNVRKEIRNTHVGFHAVAPTAARDAVVGGVAACTVDAVDPVVSEGAEVARDSVADVSPYLGGRRAAVVAVAGGEREELIPVEGEISSGEARSAAVDAEDFGGRGESMRPGAGPISLAATDVTMAAGELPASEVVATLDDGGATPTASALPLRCGSPARGSLADHGHQAEGQPSEVVERVDHAARLTHVGVWTRGPILVGHHSERRARKDAEKIRGGLERAAKAFETSDYWARRAAGAVRAAKYKERPDVRARRIKGLEADVRRHEKSQGKSTLMLRLWTKLPNAARRKDGSPMTPREQALAIANIDHGYGLWSDLNADRTTWEAAQAKRTAELPKMIAYEARWLTHLAGRLSYERGMLAEAGGTVADRTKPEIGGAVRRWGTTWLPITKVNKVTVSATDRGFGGYGTPLTRKVPITDIKAVLSPSEFAARIQAGTLAAIGPVYCDVHPDVAVPLPPAKLEMTMVPSAREKAKALRSAASGVKAVSARNLFETPPAVARQMAALAEIQPGERILEPSAGTGNLVRAIFGRTIGADGARLVTVEVNPELAAGLETQRQKTLYANADTWRIERGDFLEMTPEQLGTFHAVVMNPPFENGTDIVHVKHAMRFVRPGGCVVAVVADGPRQQEALRPIAASWEALPAGTFRGTNVRAAVVKIEVQQ